MSWLCKLGLHQIVTREATLRAGRFVSRCTCCSYVKVRKQRAASAVPARATDLARGEKWQSRSMPDPTMAVWVAPIAAPHSRSTVLRSGRKSLSVAC